MWSHHNKNWIFVMVLPSSFAATKRGYNSYVKALGFEPNSDAALLNVISFAQFSSVDRRTIEEKIDEAGEWCEKMYENYINAEKAGDQRNVDYYEGRWNYFSKRFVELVREKRSN